MLGITEHFDTMLGITNLHNSMILSTLNINSYEFILGLWRRSAICIHLLVNPGLFFKLGNEIHSQPSVTGKDGGWRRPEKGERGNGII